MKRLLLLAAAAVLLFSGCIQQPAASSITCPNHYMKIANECCLDANGNGICDRDEAANSSAGAGATGGAGPVAGAGTGATGSGGAGAGVATGPTGGANAGAGGLSFSEWKAPDGSITLQVPQGWTAVEKQVDKCTVNWVVRNPAGTSSAFMNNQIMVLKSEDARQMYKSYGLAGIDSAPLSAYLGAEQALSQVVAPLSGSSDVQIVYRDVQSSSVYSQGVCIAGLAACDAQVVEVAYTHAGVQMRGMYMVQSFDFGEGTTWWISIWGYEAPAAEWDSTNAVLQKTFASVSYTPDWASKCGIAAGAADVIHTVITDRQNASDQSAQAWDQYIRGG